MKKILFLTVLILFAASVKGAHIRVNQTGYLPSDVKNVNLFSAGSLAGLEFSVLRISDETAVFGPAPIGTALGAYSGYDYHYRLDFSALADPGEYFIRLSDGSAQSYAFEIGDCVYASAPGKVLNFIRAQRCGYNPYLGETCHASSGTGRMDGMTVGGPNPGAVIDASGAWHDAGDYIKFMINIANVSYFLLLAYYENPDVFEDEYLASGDPGSNGIPDVLDEAKYGLDWIMKMNPSADEFYYQVGDGIDHNTWRLPQNDSAAYPTAPYRPVYHCEPGKGANVAGKAAAALALANTIWTGLGDTAYADLCLMHAERIYEFGKENPEAQPSTPADFYNESSWMDDMQLGAAELYRATGFQNYLDDARLRAPSVSSGWGWTSWGVLNFYAHYSLYPNASPALQTQLKQFMQYDMNGHRAYADNDHFGIGADYVWGSMAINTAGMLNGYLYKRLFGETTYDSLVAGMRDYLLGRNQWSVSFVVGMGSDYPNNPHHQITDILNVDITGMTIEGPVSQANRNSYGASKPQPAQDPYDVFQSSTAVYYDYMPDYATNEPTIWQACITLAAFSFLADPSCLQEPTETPTPTETYTPGGPTLTFTPTPEDTATFTPTSTYTDTPEPMGGIFLEDFEDNDFDINNQGGAWYEFAEPAASSVLREVISGDTPPGGGLYSGRISGDVEGAAASWASIGAGTNLNAAGTAVDLNSTDGLRFYAKGAAGTGTNVVFRVQIVSTNITDYSLWSYAWEVKPDWTEETIPWTFFGSPGWGQGNTMILSDVLSQVQAIQFSIADTTGGVVLNTGNIWELDSVEIYGEQAEPTFTHTPTETYTPGGPTMTPTQEASNCRRFLAYYPYWVPGYKEDKIPYERLTHICHAFVQPQADGSLLAPAGFLEPALTANAAAAGVKVLVSIGGADEVSRQNFVTIAASETLRQNFADAVEAFCRTYGYAGADIDWEFPQNATERINQNLLIQAVRDKFNASSAPAPSWKITMAVSPGNWYGQWNDYDYLNNVVDYYNLMTYDFHGSWSDHSGHNAPLYRGTDPYDGENCDWSVNYMTATRGVPASMMNFGLAFYGRNFMNSSVLYDNCGGNCADEYLMYHEIEPRIGSGWTYHWDDGSKVPYLTRDAGTGVLSYDDPQSIAQKVEYALEEKGFGGIFMWDITGDYISGTQLLLEAMGSAYDSFCGIQEPATHTPTSTDTETPTETSTQTETETHTQTHTETATHTETYTYTETETPTETPVEEDTFTETPTETETETFTHTHTETETETPTHTHTATAVPTLEIAITNINPSDITVGSDVSAEIFFDNAESLTGVTVVLYTEAMAFVDSYTDSSAYAPGSSSIVISLEDAGAGIDFSGVPEGNYYIVIEGTDGAYTGDSNAFAVTAASSAPTYTPTETFTHTETFTETATETSTETFTPTETETAPEDTPTETHTHTFADTATHTPTETETIPDDTPTETYTHTFTDTQTQTPTETETIPDDTPTETNTHTHTHTFTQTSTYTHTHTYTETPTDIQTPENTYTYTPTYTNTPEFTNTPTPEPTKEELEITDAIFYPNPYNPDSGASPKFSFKITRTDVDSVSIRIYTSSSRLVREAVFEGDARAYILNTKEIDYPGFGFESMANGIYFYVIAAGYEGEVIKSKIGKMILLR